MQLRKKGYPAEDELVLCTVTAVQHNSVFAKLDEYEKSGLIHISEVSPGRIRNIRDFVKEGKVIVCKVLRVSQEKGHIDLSLRRVNEGQRRTKLDEIKKEQFAEKLIESIAKQFNLKADKLYERLFEGAEKDYGLLYPYLEAVSNGTESLAKLEIDEKIAHALETLVKDKIKPEVIHIGGRLKVTSYAPDGVKRIQETLLDAKKTKGDISLSYEGGGSYKVKVASTDFKEAEKALERFVDKAIKSFEKSHDIASFERVEEK